MSGLALGAGIVLIICSLIIILVVLSQDSKDQGLTSAIGGGYNDSFYEHNSKNTKEAKLNRFTRTATILLFLVTLAVNIIINFKK